MATTFAFDADDPRDYAGMKERQALLQAMMQQPRSSPRNVGEGISSAARDIANAFMMRQQLSQGREGRAAAKGQFQGLMSGFEGAPATPGTEPAVAPGTAPGLDAPGAPAPDLQMGAEPATPAREPGLGVLSNPKIWEFLANPYGDPNQQQFVLGQINQQIQAAQPQTPKEKLELDLLRAQIGKAQRLPRDPSADPSGPMRQDLLRAQTERAQRPQRDPTADPSGTMRRDLLQAQTERARRPSKGMNVTTNPDGTTSISFGGSGGTEKLTVDQGKNTGFLIRGRQTMKILDRLEGEGTSLGNMIKSNIPIAGNYMLTPEYRQYDQAKRDFVNATLRRESGAVISDAEFANAEVQYFPQPGDDPETIAQKRRNREAVIAGFEVGAGPGVRHPSAQPAPDTGGGWQDMGGGVRIRRKK